MKRSFYTFLAGGLLLMVASCKKEALLTYKADDNIYFKYIIGADPATDYLGLYTDTLDFTFSFSEASVTDSILNLPVGVTGVVSSQDRTFVLAVDPASTAKPGVNYEMPPSFLMRAGLISDTIRIRIKRTPELKTTALSLVLRLQENDQFKMQIEYRPRNPRSPINISDGDSVKTLSFKLSIADMLAPGPYWAQHYEYSFGTFSEKKVRLMNQITGMPLSFWSKPLNTAQERSDAAYYGSLMARYLSDQAFAGNIILEADGITPMKMGMRFP